MATNTDEAERRVREQRALIQRKVGALEDRVVEDVSQARARVKYHVTHAADTLPGGPQVIAQVEQHPAAALAGGVGIGVAAGMMGGRGSKSNDRGSDNRNGRSDDSNGMFLGSIASSLIMPMRPYFEDAAKELIAGFGDRRSGSSRTASRGNSQAPSDGQTPTMPPEERTATPDGSRA